MLLHRRSPGESYEVQLTANPVDVTSLLFSSQFHAVRNKELKRAIAQTLEFARKYPGFHSFMDTGLTQKTVRWLADRGWVQINRYGQFRAVNSDGEYFDNSTHYRSH